MGCCKSKKAAYQELDERSESPIRVADETIRGNCPITASSAPGPGTQHIAKAKDVDELMEWVRGNKPDLLELDLSHAVDDVHISVVIAALETNDTLQRINLQGYQLSLELAFELGSTLAAYTFSARELVLSDSIPLWALRDEDEACLDISLRHYQDQDIGVLCGFLEAFCETPLRSLEVPEFGVGLEAARLLGKSLRVHKHLEALTIAGNTLPISRLKAHPSQVVCSGGYGDIEVATVCGLLGNAKVKRMQLSHNKLSAVGVAFLSDLPNLESLDLSYNKIAHGEGLVKLSRTSWPDKVLDLSHNRLGDDAAVVLAQSLPRHNAGLTIDTLQLSCNRFGPTGIEVLAEALRDGSVQTLTLDGPALDDEHAAPLLAAAVMSMKSSESFNGLPLGALRRDVDSGPSTTSRSALDDLEATGLQMDDKWAEVAGEGEYGTQNVTKHGVMDMRGAKHYRVEAREALRSEVTEKRIRLADAIVLANSLSGKLHTHTICLLEYRMRSPAVKALADGLAWGNESVTSLDLRGNLLGHEAAESLSSLLRSKCPIKVLLLGGQARACATGFLGGLGDLGATALREGVAKSVNLEKLDLSWNNIGCVGAKALAAALACNLVLKELSLHGNRIGSNGVSAIIQALKGGDCGLTRLSLRVNDIDSEAATALELLQAVGEGDEGQESAEGRSIVFCPSLRGTPKSIKKASRVSKAHNHTMMLTRFGGTGDEGDEGNGPECSECEFELEGDEGYTCSLGCNFILCDQCAIDTELSQTPDAAPVEVDCGGGETASAIVHETLFKEHIWARVLTALQVGEWPNLISCCKGAKRASTSSAAWNHVLAARWPAEANQALLQGKVAPADFYRRQVIAAVATEWLSAYRPPQWDIVHECLESEALLKPCRLISMVCTGFEQKQPFLRLLPDDSDGEVLAEILEELMDEEGEDLRAELRKRGFSSHGSDEAMAHRLAAFKAAERGGEINSMLWTFKPPRDQPPMPSPGWIQAWNALHDNTKGEALRGGMASWDDLLNAQPEDGGPPDGLEETGDDDDGQAIEEALYHAWEHGQELLLHAKGDGQKGEQEADTEHMLTSKEAAVDNGQPDECEPATTVLRYRSVTNPTRAPVRTNDPLVHLLDCHVERLLNKAFVTMPELEGAEFGAEDIPAGKGPYRFGFAALGSFQFAKKLERRRVPNPHIRHCWLRVHDPIAFCLREISSGPPKPFTRDDDEETSFFPEEARCEEDVWIMRAQSAERHILALTEGRRLISALARSAGESSVSDCDWYMSAHAGDDREGIFPDGRDCLLAAIGRRPQGGRRVAMLYQWHPCFYAA